MNKLSILNLYLSVFLYVSICLNVSHKETGSDLDTRNTLSIINSIQFLIQNCFIGMTVNDTILPKLSIHVQKDKINKIII